MGMASSYKMKRRKQNELNLFLAIAKVNFVTSTKVSYDDKFRRLMRKAANEEFVDENHSNIQVYKLEYNG